MWVLWIKLNPHYFKTTTATASKSPSTYIQTHSPLFASLYQHLEIENQNTVAILSVMNETGAKYWGS